MGKDENEKKFVTKKCPECFVYLKLDDEQCHHCKTRLGKVDKHGMAKRLVDWKAYLVCLIACSALALYLFLAY